MQASPPTAQRAREEPSTAIVVGAGVSGCACAAVLASRGVRVTVLNSALDRVNLPGYGPDVIAGAGGWGEIGETMAALPLALRQAWLNAAAVPDSGAPLLNVDRRAVSIEAKRALERMPGLEFRQGLVTDVRMTSEARRGPGDRGHGRVAVETVFGEVFEADAVVLAVGLGLGGRVAVGADTSPGGRYGETPADGLREALEALGISFREVTLAVGARFASCGTALVDALARGASGHERRRTIGVRALLDGSREHDPEDAPGLEQAWQALMTGFSSALPRNPYVPGKTSSPGTGDAPGKSEAGSATRRSVSSGAGAVSEVVTRGLPEPRGWEEGWGEGYPPASHWLQELRIDQMLLDETQDGGPVPLVSPDGIATSEMYLSPEGAHLERAERAGTRGDEGEVNGWTLAPASRLGHMVRAQVVTGLGPSGRIQAGSGEWSRIWVAGRAAGARDYLTSLRSGAEAGDDVAEVLEGGLADSGGDRAGSWNRCTGRGARSSAERPACARVPSTQPRPGVDEESGR